MTREIKKYLFDIYSAADHILTLHLAGISSADDYAANLTVQRAVEREPGIIGEAAYQLQKRKFFFAGQDQVINRRNTLIHQYDAASPSQVWNYVQSELGTIKNEAGHWLEER